MEFVHDIPNSISVPEHKITTDASNRLKRIRIDETNLFLSEEILDNTRKTEHGLTNEDPVPYNDYEVSLVFVTLTIKIRKP